MGLGDKPNYCRSFDKHFRWYHWFDTYVHVVLVLPGSTIAVHSSSWLICKGGGAEPRGRSAEKGVVKGVVPLIGT